MKVTTKEGFACVINEDALGDWEMIEKMIDVQKGDITLLPGVMKDLIGEDGYQNAKDFVRGDNGRVPTQQLTELFFSVLTKAKDRQDAKKK